MPDSSFSASFFPTLSNVPSSALNAYPGGSVVTFPRNVWYDNFRIKKESEKLKTEDTVPHEQPPAPLLGR